MIRVVFRGSLNLYSCELLLIKGTALGNDWKSEKAIRSTRLLISHLISSSLESKTFYADLTLTHSEQNFNACAFYYEQVAT